MKKTYIFLLVFIILAVTMTSCGKRPVETDVPAVLAEEITGEITISYYDAGGYNKKFIEEAAKLFEREYPGTKINTEAFSVLPERKSVTVINDDGSKITVVANVTDEDSAIPDYVRRTNTELMSGKGADVFLSTNLPVYKYVKSGSFEDLRPFMNADSNFVSNDYLSNILNSTAQESGQYIIPASFTFLFVTFDKDKIDTAAATVLRSKNKFTYWELTDLVKDRFSNDDNEYTVINFGSGGYLDYMFNYMQFIDIENKKANFTGGKFVELLNIIKEHQQNSYLCSTKMFQAEILKRLRKNTPTALVLTTLKLSRRVS